jgi:hypothetical protein
MKLDERFLLRRFHRHYLPHLLMRNSGRRLAWSRAVCLILISAAAGCVAPLSFADTVSGDVEATSPKTVLWDGAHMLRLLEQEPTKSVRKALERLETATDDVIDNGPFSVTKKKKAPPSGDQHDYQSFSRYWWPNPETEDGLPYIRKDGHVNRKLVNRGDRSPLGDLVDTVPTLSLAYYFLDDQQAGKRAAQLVKVWFLNPETRMNPNLNFGQSVPGRAAGRGAGIIDTRGFMLVLDALELLDESVGWGKSQQAALQDWFREYVGWLQASELGRHEQDAKNNHGSWYAAQVARYSVFAGDFATAKRVLKRVRDERLEYQFEPDGMQPQALKRTLSLHYSMFNLSALVVLARVGEHPEVDVDLWSHLPEHGCGLEKAHRALLPYIDGSQEWEHQQISPYRISRSTHLALRFVSQRYADESFQHLVREVKIKEGHADFTELLAAKYVGEPQ